MNLNFITRRLPQSVEQPSANTLANHIAADNPHSQYLLVSQFTSALEGNIDPDLFVLKSDFNNHTDVLITPNPHSQYLLKSDFTTWKNSHLDQNTDPHSQYLLRGELADIISSATSGGFTAIDLVGTSTSNPPSTSDTGKPLAGYWGAYLKGQHDSHVQTFNEHVNSLSSHGIFPTTAWKDNVYLNDLGFNHNDGSVSNGKFYVTTDSNADYNAPYRGFHGFVEVFVIVGDNLPTTESSGTVVVFQKAITESGTEFNRVLTITGKNIPDGLVYSGIWSCIEGESVTPQVMEPSNTYTASRLTARTHCIRLRSNCTVWITDMVPGETLDLRVETDGTYTLTFNDLVILNTNDIGTFVCKFRYIAGVVQLEAVLSLPSTQTI